MDAPESALSVLVVRPGGASVPGTMPEALPADGFVWIDCRADAARAWVEPVRRLTGVEVFEAHLLDAENAGHPSFFDSTPRYEMIIFRGLAIATPDVHDAGEPIRIRTRPTSFYLLHRCLVTVHTGEEPLVGALRKRLLDAAQHRQRVPSCPEELMLRLLNQMVDRFLDLRQPLTAQVEHWQRLLLDPRRPFHDWLPLLEMRSEARKLEQLCEEQLDAIQEWRDERIEHVEHAEHAEHGEHWTALPPLGSDLQVRSADVVNHIQRVLSHARRMESSVESAVQLHFSATAHRTNEIMRTLTTITAIFMPLTLITGVFGMNFEFMPVIHMRTGFWATMGAMVLIGLALLVWFRARRVISLRSFDREWQRRGRRD